MEVACYFYALSLKGILNKKIPGKKLSSLPVCLATDTVVYSCKKFKDDKWAGVV